MTSKNRKPYGRFFYNITYCIQRSSQAETIARLQEKLELSREKCKKYKGIKEQLQKASMSLSQRVKSDSISLSCQTVHDLQSQLGKAIAERDAANERTLAADERTAVVIARAEATTPLNAAEFLASPSPETPQPPIRSIEPYSTGLKFVIPKTARDICVSDGWCSYSKHETIWPDSVTTHCLVFAPMHWYNGKGNDGKGAWEKTISHQEQKLRPGQKRDLFYLEGRSWYYYGTFECVGVTAMSSDQAQNLRPDLMEYVEKRTVLFPDLVPPFITKMVHSMYAEGVLKVECFGMRCVGFNHELDQALRSFSGPKAGLTVISVPKEGCTKKGHHPKRIHDGDGTARPHKKQKK
ncbi:hypothetical protein A0H81_00681 [Grifola frondosa]|uniref:Uncharacterized protein n=1 Tax=Grifola frondosa TaxID=5627 RepID=A0A1C7MQ54_GRIFR|nr:hypothetical protein A0H81_00681 [Grifola frondosa]